MQVARVFNSVRYQNFCKYIVRFSSQNASQATQPLVQDEKFDFEDLKVIDRIERRKAKIPPFMKDVFVSVYNRELLAFPEILNKEETESLEQRVKILETIFSDRGKGKEDRREALKKTGLYGAPLNITSGGLQMNATESLRYLDVISSDLQLAQQISDHWVGLEALKVGLSTEEFQKITDDLISGENPIGLCIKEKLSQRISQPDFRTTAELDGQGIWCITGEKVCYNTGGYYLVLCTSEANRMKALLVHPKAAGIQHDDTYISFLKTPGIPLEQCTEQQMAQVLGVSRLHAATMCRQGLAQALAATSEYVHSRAFAGKPLAELSTIRATFGEAALDLYASESAEYFTAGLLDGYMDPDVELEVAMCRNFIASHSMETALKLLAISSVEMPQECARILDGMRHLVLRGETLDSVKMFIALNGIHHAGKHMAEEVKQIRNPLFHPTFIIKKVIANRHQEKDDPKLNLFLAEHLHPSLRPVAEQLEYCVLRMKFACETLMSRHGVEIGSAFTELNRLAEAATYILVLTSVLARASRSYCIGVRNGELEMKLAACFVEQTKDKVKRLILDIDNGEYLNLDHYKLHFGKRVLDSRSLVVEKPTARTFW